MIDVPVLKRLVSDHLGEIHSLSDVARLSGCSRETIRKRFVNSELVPLSDFIIFERIEKAKRLLTSTTLTCCEVCNEVGFSRPEVAMRDFKRFTGVTMKRYRKDSR